MKYLNITGNPIAQKRHRFARGFVYDPSSKDKKQVIYQVVEQFREKPMVGPVYIDFTFICKRPKSHYRTGKFANILKHTSPEYMVKKADIDNFIKFYMDCMNKICYLDDAQVYSIAAKKRYVEEDEEPCVEILLEEVNGD
tara:strand:- start:99 stop:518 length:420 start_codon:yes stop_codon:yes gene_type:complete